MLMFNLNEMKLIFYNYYEYRIFIINYGFNFLSKKKIVVFLIYIFQCKNAFLLSTNEYIFYFILFDKEQRKKIVFCNRY